MPRRQNHALFERQQHLEAAKLLSLGNSIHALEMKDYLPLMVLTEPAGFQPQSPRLTLAARIAYKHFRQFGQPLRKISE